MTSRAPTAAFLAMLVASALHFADNALRFGHYHDDAMRWLTPAIVVVAWFVQSALGVAGLFLHHRHQRGGGPLLVAYGILGFAGLLHYAAGMPDPDAWMHVLIAFEALAGTLLLMALARARWPSPRPA